MKLYLAVLAIGFAVPLACASENGGVAPADRLHHGYSGLPEGSSSGESRRERSVLYAAFCPADFVDSLADITMRTSGKQGAILVHHPPADGITGIDILGNQELHEIGRSNEGDFARSNIRFIDDAPTPPELSVGQLQRQLNWFNHTAAYTARQ